MSGQDLALRHHTQATPWHLLTSYYSTCHWGEGKPSLKQLHGMLNAPLVLQGHVRLGDKSRPSVVATGASRESRGTKEPCGLQDHHWTDYFHTYINPSIQLRIVTYSSTQLYTYIPMYIGAVCQRHQPLLLSYHYAPLWKRHHKSLSAVEANIHVRRMASSL